MFQPSPQQLSIFDAISSASSNIIVDAKAGSGKTTTTLEGMKHVPRGTALLAPSITFIAFGKQIADTLESRVPKGTSVGTFHRFGRRALATSGLVDPQRTRQKDWVDGRKISKLVWNAMGKDQDVQSVIRLVSLAKSRSIILDSDNFWQELIVHHDIDLENPKQGIQVAKAALTASNKNFDTIDFDDMLYMPITYNIPFDIYDWVFVDEAQDLNEIQHEIITRIMRSSSRLCAVGDPHQAIYGFRGAASDSMDILQKRFSCVTYPLSVSYRCSKAVVKEAQRFLV